MLGMTDIVMVTHNRKDFTVEVLKHLYRNTFSPFRLIIVDNGSTDGTVEELNHVTDEHKVILLPENMGLEYAKNLGLNEVQTTRYIDTDNDCLPPLLEPDWLTQINALMDRHPEFGAISMRPQILVGVGKIFDAEHEVAENNVAGGSLRLMDTALVRKVGGWRDEKGQNRSEEWHISGKLRGEGKKVGYARDLFCYHMFGEDHAWGYGDIDHKHGDRKCAYVDSMFPHDPSTLVPSSKHNE